MCWGRDWDRGWRPYVPVAQRRAKAMRAMEKLAKKGQPIQPVKIAGRKIATTFWGAAWCDHLEKFSDYANRLPRGRTYVRNGSVCHLDIKKGVIQAKVSGSEIYNVEISIKSLPKPQWTAVKQSCAGQVGSLLELLQGKLSNQVMTVVTDKQNGLFPQPKEISLKCSCPDWANMCKHVAAVMYGVGARLDEKPDLLFVLRGVDHQELVAVEAAKTVVRKASRKGARTLAESELGDVFGIDLAPPMAASPVPAKSEVRRKKTPSRSKQPPTPNTSADRSSRKTGPRTRGSQARLDQKSESL